MAKKKWLLAGIDVGTTKIFTTVGEVEGETVQILGSGWSTSRGLKKGMVANLSETISSIRESLQKAEEESQHTIDSAYVSVGGGHLRGLNRIGKTQVRNADQEISAEHIAEALNDARSFEVPEGWQIIHELTQSFTLDGQEGIVDPLGMSGRTLSVNLHLVLNASAVVQNIVNAVNKAGVLVNGVVMQQLASAESILSPDEKELGVVVIDIGGGTTDVAVYRHGSIWHTEVLPLGGSLITKDIAIGLKAPLLEAENLKKESATVLPASVPPEEVIEVTEVGTGRRRTVSRQLLCQIVQARVEEILHSVNRIMQDAEVQSDLTTGVVLTGGGSLLDGLVEFAEDIVQMPVRLGYPVNLVSLESHLFHPAYSTAFGLLRYAHAIQSNDMATALGEERRRSLSKEKRRSERMKNWILERIS
ncbi:MAG: cell division protein FtsA [Acidobacteria bacterium]|nr:cell division protein FtsA [Acidobacteriota bacterium]